MSTIPRPDAFTGSEDELAYLLGDTYICTRAWEAWEAGTMTEEDFTPANTPDVRADLIEWRDAAVAAERERIAAGGSVNLANLTVPEIRQAISDPGSVLPRIGGYGVNGDEPESLPNWQARAVLLTVTATVNRALKHDVARAVASEREQVARFVDQAAANHEQGKFLVVPLADAIRDGWHTKQVPDA